MRTTILIGASLALLCGVGSFSASAQVVLSCATGKNSATQGAGQPQAMNFTNNTPNLYHVYWVDSSGASQYIGNVPENGGQRDLQAAPGTTFEVADDAGACVTVFRMTADQDHWGIYE